MRCVIVVSDKVDRVVEYDTRAEIDAYLEGVSVGAGMYGAMNWSVFHPDTDHEDLSPEASDAVKKALEGDG